MIEPLRVCLARLMGQGLSYEDARHGCLLPGPARPSASVVEVLVHWWWLLGVGFGLAVVLPLVVDWDRSRRGKYTL